MINRSPRPPVDDPGVRPAGPIFRTLRVRPRIPSARRAPPSCGGAQAFSALGQASRQSSQFPTSVPRLAHRPSVPRPQARHPSQHRVDVASQGGCAGPGRVRYRRARRAVRAGWLGAEPRDRERSSGRGLEDFRRRAAAAAQDPRRVGSSEDHLEASWADFGFIRSPASAGTGIIRWASVS
jgi:hypothetical protein